MTNANSFAICAARRKPLGAFMGALSPLAVPALGAAATTTVISDASLGQAPVRQATQRAKNDDSLGAATIDKVCGPGMNTTMTAADLLLPERASIVVAGGMETMSRAPFLAPDMRSGRKAGSTRLLNHMMFGGLEDAFAIETLERARHSISSGAFHEEISPVTIETRKGEVPTNAGWAVDRVALWEVNETFAVVLMAAVKDIGIPRDRLNVKDGACDPIGASGARIVVTLLYALRAAGGRRGVASLCIGGGEATALAIEIKN